MAKAEIANLGRTTMQFQEGVPWRNWMYITIGHKCKLPRNAGDPLTEAAAQVFVYINLYQLK